MFSMIITYMIQCHGITKKRKKVGACRVSAIIIELSFSVITHEMFHFTFHLTIERLDCAMDYLV